MRCLPEPNLQLLYGFPKWGRTGFDLGSDDRTACRGRLVGLVKNRVKKSTANQELALAA